MDFKLPMEDGSSCIITAFPRLASNTPLHLPISVFCYFFCSRACSALFNTWKKPRACTIRSLGMY